MSDNSLYSALAYAKLGVVLCQLDASLRPVVRPDWKRHPRLEVLFMSIILLKTLHFLSLLFAGGVTVGSVVVQRAYVAADEIPPPHVRKAFALLSYMGLGAIVTLWVTGIGLAHLIYGGLAINGAFHVKLLGAAVVLGISVWGNLHAYSAAKAGIPPNAILMKRLVSAARSGLLIAIVGAAVAFA